MGTVLVEVGSPLERIAGVDEARTAVGTAAVYRCRSAGGLDHRKCSIPRHQRTSFLSEVGFGVRGRLGVFPDVACTWSSVAW